MQWELLTSPDFRAAVERTKTCVLTLGVLEKHGDHLCLGTDYLTAHRIGCLAAEAEEAVVFPPFYFGQIYEARCFPGCVTLSPTLTMQVLEGVMDEIGRNGFEKIVIFNGHGGNNAMLTFLAQCSLWKQKPYTVYVQKMDCWVPDPELKAQWKALQESEFHGHACECETSYLMCDYPGGVRMDAVSDPKVGESLNRLAHLKDAFLGVSWYASFPEHYAGDARTANAEKGRKFRDILVQSLADFIKRVKADTVAPDLEKEFFIRENQIREFDR